MKTNYLMLAAALTWATLMPPRLSLADGPDGLAGNPPPPSDGLLYSVDVTSGNLVTIDPNTAAVSVVGPTGFNFVEGLTYHAPTGVLLGVDVDSDQLISINRHTGAGVAIGAIDRDFVFGLTYSEHDDTLYGVDTLNNELLSIDPTTGATSTLGAHAYDFVGGLTDDPATGTLYAADYGQDAVFTIALAEGVVPVFSAPIIDLSPASSQGLAYDSTTDDLFVIDPEVGPDTLLRINRFTDTVSLVGPLDSATVTSLEFVPNSVAVPEPHGLLLTALCVVGCAVAARRRF